MKHLARTRPWIFIFIVGAIALVVLGVLVWRPLLIAYHRSAMVNIWQTEHGIVPRKGVVASVRKMVGLSPAPPDHRAAARAFWHREALCKLGYLSKRTFTLDPVSVVTEDYRQLCDKVAAQTGQQPTAGFEYDQPASSGVVLGLTVYATPAEMPRWEQFIANLTENARNHLTNPVGSLSSQLPNRWVVHENQDTSYHFTFCKTTRGTYHQVSHGRVGDQVYSWRTKADTTCLSVGFTRDADVLKSDRTNGLALPAEYRLLDAAIVQPDGRTTPLQMPSERRSITSYTPQTKEYMHSWNVPESITNLTDCELRFSRKQDGKDVAAFRLQ